MLLTSGTTVEPLECRSGCCGCIGNPRVVARDENPYELDALRVYFITNMRETQAFIDN